MSGEALLRVANVDGEAGVEEVRDLLDDLGVEYEHVRSEPENSYPQTVYFYVPDEQSENVEHAMTRLAEKHGYDAEVL